MIRHLLLGAATLPLLLSGAGVASAQALAPMREMVTSYEDRFALRVFAKNPYQHRIKMVVRVYDHNFNVVKANVQPREMTVGAGDSRRVTVVVPFEGQKERRVRICAESVPLPSKTTRIRTRVCGRFLATREG